MISAEQNELMTRVGRGTPAGALLRQYWQPIALAEELPAERPLKALHVFGEALVLFRDEQGRYGLVDRVCPHRGADLAYGRLEDGGLRCAFHGWLFDVAGHCLETPAEPEGSRICEQVRQNAYPVVEKNGLLFAYLGAGEPPAFPAFDCFVAPDAYTFAFKGYLECNWLQALEVGIDPAHASFLHRFFEDEDPAAAYGKQFRDASGDTAMPMTRVLREFSRPEIKLERTDYGIRLFALRKLSEAHTHVRVTNLVFPQAIVIPMSAEMTITQWHVPVDDVSCYWVALFTSFGEPVNKAKMRAQRLELYALPDYKPRLNRTNDWGFNAGEQRSSTYTGMGDDINVHDQWAVESQGRIADRTREHLGSTDKGIVQYRRLLLDAIRRQGAGEKALMMLDATAAGRLTGPATIDGVAPAASVDAYWKEADRKRRDAAAWRRHSTTAQTA